MNNSLKLISQSMIQLKIISKDHTGIYTCFTDSHSKVTLPPRCCGDAVATDEAISNSLKQISQKHDTIEDYLKK